MNQIVECVPNFSEGRNKEVLDAIANAVKAVDGAMLLDVDPGFATNRTVFTFVGSPKAITEAAFQAIKAGSELIDMREHSGEHARMGACDVCPFIPVSGITIEDCVEISKKVGRRVGEELNIPVFLYEHSATKPERKNLANIRKGEYEGMAEKLKDTNWKPDFGKDFNVKSGVTAIGCRDFLIAYNINLNTKNKKIAHDIALNIREEGRIIRDNAGNPVKNEAGEFLRGEKGFPGVKAVGWYIDEYGKAQISMNITNYQKGPLHKIFEFAEQDAIRHGVRVTGSEVVGLIPREPLIAAGKYFLAKQHLDDDQYLSAGVGERGLIAVAVDTLGLSELGEFNINEKVIEYKLEKERLLRKMTVTDFVDELASDSAAPGGGSIAALSGALSAGLASMVANLTTKKLTFTKLSDKKKEKRETMLTLAVKAQEIKDKLLELIDTDTEAFDNFMAALQLPQGTKDEKKLRADAIENASKTATLVPLETMKLSYEAIECARIVAEKGLKNALSDAGVSALTGLAAVKGAYMNVKINLGGIADETFKQKINSEADAIYHQAITQAGEIEASVMSKLL
ncbi:MAG: glutamate formimidoyltransferase [Candidatus Marinimicrobia bacterium]|nr:glutamate formimidoyltransferase [Candidatus Neomarinimicrobiota bacterium]